MGYLFLVGPNILLSTVVQQPVVIEEFSQGKMSTCLSTLPDGEAIYSQQKQDWELTVAQIMNSLLPNSELN